MPTSAPPIRTELFRFLSYKSPQLIALDRKHLGFVVPPDGGASHFLAKLDSQSLDDARSTVRARRDGFKALRSRDQIRAIAPALYDASQRLYAQRTRKWAWDELANIRQITPLAARDEASVWDQLLCQLLDRDNPPLRQACIQMLVANHFIDVIRRPGFAELAESVVTTPRLPIPPSSPERVGLLLKRLANAKVVIPKAFSQDKTAKKNGGHGAGRDILFGVNQIGVGVMRKVEQEVCCYVAGEVSHVENILAREYKERHTRSLQSTETTSDDVTEYESERQTDTMTTARNEMQSAAATVINNDTSVGASTGSGASGKLAGFSVSANASFDFGYSNGTSRSDSDAWTYAQDVTQQALDRVRQKSSAKRTSRMLQEFEENNRHGFDNRKGDQHVTGVYRWLDILYKNRLINYGKRLMVEFLVPEPARFYQQAVDRAGRSRGEKSSSGSAKPEPPATLAIKTASEITRDNYAELARQFETTLEEPLTPAERSVNVDLRAGDSPAGKPDPKGKDENYTFSLAIPYGYHLTAAHLGVRFEYHLYATETGTYMTMSMAGQSATRDKDAHGRIDALEKTKPRHREWATLEPLPWTYAGNLVDRVTLKLDMKNVYDFNVTGSLSYAVSPTEFSAWQERCFAALQAAYNRQYDAYERDLAAGQQNKDDDAPTAKSESPRYGASPSENRGTERQELKRSAIDMLNQPFGHPVGRDFLDAGPCKVPEIRQDHQWDVYASHVKFFEQAFEWDGMAYTFYPYYWADRCDWEAKLLLTCPSDPTFAAFLQSGMARVVVAARPGFEDAVNYYFETGDIWNGGDLVIDTDDDLYVSIAEELQEIEGFVEDEWETRVPTTLTIVQGDSVLLDDGLPCCKDVEDTRLRGSKQLLERATDV